MNTIQAAGPVMPAPEILLALELLHGACNALEVAIDNLGPKLKSALGDGAPHDSHTPVSRKTDLGNTISIRTAEILNSIERIDSFTARLELP